MKSFLPSLLNFYVGLWAMCCVISALKLYRAFGGIPSFGVMILCGMAGWALAQWLRRTPIIPGDLYPGICRIAALTFVLPAIYAINKQGGNLADAAHSAAGFFLFLSFVPKDGLKRHFEAFKQKVVRTFARPVMGGAMVPVRGRR